MDVAMSERRRLAASILHLSLDDYNNIALVKSYLQLCHSSYCHF